ncbi:MAG: aspartate carbamoyltransferase [Peptoniphilus sp.]|nr:aspartate carbamoyltransferase [Peptoniphilus sp.]MDD7363241.1 aspartate carbamoyltransferase [Bacillota bacterium]MDY6045334.1 aspartate carbamoyltransferase [Peptoniphilus sp.]
MLRHFIEPSDFDKREYDALFRLAADIASNPKTYAHACDGKILASLFFEPSTRTRMSFDAAMYRLGGQVLHLGDAKVSSLAKGESVRDTLHIVDQYADICAMRHPVAYTQHYAVDVLKNMPLINAGDGDHAHPTQTLADIYTIRDQKGSWSNLKIGFCGDLRYGRAVHSLFEFLNDYDDEFVFIAPKGLDMPSNYLEQSTCPYEEVDDLQSVIGDLDVLYMTRVQRERFASLEEAKRYQGSYLLNQEVLNHASEDLIVLHPLPRVDEIDIEVDDDPRALYFEQAKNGMYMRMALILTLLEAKYENSRE